MKMHKLYRSVVLVKADHPLTH